MGNSSRHYGVLVVFVCLLTVLGCSTSSPPPPNPVTQSQPPGPAMGAGPPSSAAAASGSRTQHLDFPDIPVPTELDVRPSESNVFVTGQLRMGFITLRGRVDPSSLITFFTMALPHEGWKLKGEFRYSRSLLVFEKPDRTCVMIFRESTIYTYVEIYVAPVPS